jgi:hypothetical protein
MTVQGIGASLSPALGGWVAELAGYPVAFEVLGAIAVGSIVLWVGFAGLLRPACAVEGSPFARRSGKRSIGRGAGSSFK